MRFVKAHTNGNDFVITMDKIDLGKIKLIANRNFGIGCDQFIFVENISCDYYKVEFFNQNGSKAEMCGNGACAVILYIKDFLNSELSEFCLLISGKKYKSAIEHDVVSIEIPTPQILESFENIKIVSTGNKHLIYEMNTESISDNSVKKLRSIYPDYNIHFLYKISERVLKIKTLERGVGWTKACGSGAIASAFSTEHLGEIKVIHEGGESKVIVNSDKLIFQARPEILFIGETYKWNL